MDSLPNNFDPTKIPIALNPDGGPPSFMDPPSLAHAILAVGLTLIVISGICVILRLVTNFKYIGRLQLDDYLCLFAEIGGIGYWGVTYSFKDSARHSWDIPLSAVTKSFIKRQFALQVIAGPTMWASKAAILALYIRLFGGVRWLRFACFGLLTVTFLFYWSNVAIASVFCIPENGAPWDASSLKRCGSPVTAVVLNGVFGVVADLVLFVLPFPIILNLQVGKKKIGLIIVFLLGFLEVIASVVSLCFRVRVFLGRDAVWNGFELSIVTFGEVFGTVIVSCAPALYSFWFNIITPSKVYSSIRSRLISRISPPSSREDVGVEITKGGLQLNVSSSSRKLNGAYDELEDCSAKSSGLPQNAGAMLS